MRRALAGFCLALLVVARAAAANTIVTPGDFGGPYCLSPAFGAATCALAGEYRAGGLEFSGMGVSTASFNDPPLAWGGINGSGIVDLLSPVNGMIVVPATSIPGITNFISVEAGSSAPNTLRLSVFSASGALITSVSNDGTFGIGPHGNQLMTIAAAGIAKFSVSTPGNDSFGVDQIELGPINGGSVAPAPSLSFPSLLALVLAVCGLGGWRLARRQRELAEPPLR